MRGQQTRHLTIYINMCNLVPKALFNMWTVSSGVSIQKRHWQPLSVHLWAYCTHPTHDVWKLATPPGSTSPTLFEQWSGFFYVPQEPDKCKCCETGPTVSRPYPRRLASLTVAGQMLLQRQLFLLSYLKTLGVGPAGVRNRDLPLSRPALSQLR